MEKYTWLKTNPETVKAIIMASAIHDIEGWTTLSDKDGAGGIVASEALAVFERGGWAHILIEDMNNPNTYFSGDGSHYDFKSSDFDIGTTYASAGERVRAVVTWDSNPTTDYSTPGTDKLSTNFDLQIVDPDGNPINWPKSISWANNYEIVDFVAKKSGEYKMRVTFHRESLESSWLGVGLAWLRVPAQYLPDIKARYGAWWDSEVVIRNEAATDKDVTITYLNPDGTYEASVSHIIPKNGTWSHRPRDYPTYLYEFSGSAIVSAGEDVSVVVVNTTTSKAYGYNGIAPAGGTGSPGFGVAGAEVHLPLVMNGHSSWYSHLAVQNTGAAQASVTVYFENHSPPRSYTITQAGGLFLDDLSFLGTPYLGSARITSDQPVAAMASHWKDTSSVHVAYAHSAYTSGTATNHLPLVFRRYNPTSNSGWCTGVDVRNLGISGTNVTLTYRPTNLGGTYTATKWVPANGGTNFWLPSLSGFPDGSYGVATLSAGQPLVSVVNTTKYASDVALSYNGFLDTDGTDAVILPLVYKGYSGWDTGVQVHNVGSQGTNVRIDYHATNGNWQCSDGPFAVASQEGHNFYQPSSCLPSGFVGSAVVTASGGDERIVAQVNAMNYGASYAVSYNGISR